MIGDASSADPGVSKRLVRLAALGEFLGVFFTAIVVQRLLLRGLGVAGWKATQAEMLETGGVDFLVLSRLAAIDQALRYGVLLGLAFAIGYWHRRRRPASYGLTRSGRGWLELLVSGVVLWGVGKLPTALLLAADDHLPWIGSGPDHWAVFPPKWSPEFVLYMAVSSFLLVPILEELAFRGYLLGRLREDYGEGAALLLAVVFFTLVHTQYFKAEVLSLGLLLGLAVFTTATGYVWLRTGSLVPCIVGHALANLPTPPGKWSEEVVFGLTLAVVIAAWRPISAWTRDLVSLGRRRSAWSGASLGLALLLATLCGVFLAPSRVAILATSLLAAGLAGDAVDRRRRGRVR